MKSIFQIICVGISLVLLASSCKTKDILPTAEISLSQNTLSEAGGTLSITAYLNAPANSLITIRLAFSGTATYGSDYSVSSNEIVINPGEISGSIMLTGINDGEVEGNEEIIVTSESKSGVLILSYESYIITILDANIDSDGDGVPDSDDDCPDLFGDPDNNGCPFLGFIINEVLYDPADGIVGDANGDGIRDPLDDEFIEFFNSSPTSIDLSGYSISDASQVRHVFPEGTIVTSNGVIVVFGGGTPTGTFGGAIVQTASQGQLNMNNQGDFMTIRDASNVTILTFDINPLSGNPNESYTRSPDIYGDFARHSVIPAANGAIHSPGVQLNGNPF